LPESWHASADIGDAPWTGIAQGDIALLPAILGGTYVAA
jgi:hypothetical protein